MRTGASSEHPLRSSQGRVRAWTAAPSTLPNPRVPCAPQAATVWEGDIHAPGCKFAVVVGQFNSLVTDRLESGALAGLRKAGVEDSNVDVVHVPGSFEIPVVAKSMAMTGKYDAVICIGAVVRGATTHYEEVCGAATTGCGHAAVSTGTDHPAVCSCGCFLEAQQYQSFVKNWMLPCIVTCAHCFRSADHIRSHHHRDHGASTRPRWRQGWKQGIRVSHDCDRNGVCDVQIASRGESCSCFSILVMCRAYFNIFCLFLALHCYR